MQRARPAMSALRERACQRDANRAAARGEAAPNGPISIAAANGVIADQRIGGRQRQRGPSRRSASGRSAARRSGRRPAPNLPGRSLMIDELASCGDQLGDDFAGFGGAVHVGEGLVVDRGKGDGVAGLQQEGRIAMRADRSAPACGRADASRSGRRGIARRSGRRRSRSCRPASAAAGFAAAASAATVRRPLR